ncbi:MAG: homoserine dehydrogenase [Pseudomonadota bacterium]
MYSAMVRRALAERATPIRFGLIGAGAMGKGLLYQIMMTPGVRCSGLADIRIDAAIACAEEFAIPYRVVETAGELEDAAAAGVLPICEDGMLVAGADATDTLVEASSAIIPGAEFSLRAIEAGKHVILMNAEVDQAFGPALAERARKAGVICTSCDGDQHGVLKNVISDLELWGFELVMAGNIKGFHDIRANPVDIKPEADKRKLDYKMCTAYTDGTKLNIEMSVIANALGLRTDVPGMHGPKAAHVDEVLDLFDFDELREGGPVIDYILGAQPGGGVFAVGYHEQPFQQFMMDYYKMGPGPYYVFYRPYHLCHVEAMASMVQPTLHGTGLLESPSRFHTNVFAYSKTPLAAGTELDGLGGHALYGLVENVPDGKHQGLPICLAEDVRLVRDVPADQPILLSDIEVDPNRLDFELYAESLEVTARDIASTEEADSRSHALRS